MRTSFVVVSAGRSGSSLLGSTLRAHPDIYCHGEIFHPIVKRQVRPEFLARFGIDLRESDPQQFARAVLAFSPDQRCVGFKMWRKQNPDVCDALLADRSVKKIILDRGNRLAAYSSSRLARASGTWNLRANPSEEKLAAARALKIPFDRKAFLAFVDYRDRLFRHYRDAAAGAVLEISYAEIAAPGGFDRVLDFLEVERLPLSPGKTKLHPSDILSRFELAAREEVVELLRKICRPEWVVEEIGPLSTTG